MINIRKDNVFLNAKLYHYYNQSYNKEEDKDDRKEIIISSFEDLTILN